MNYFPFFKKFYVGREPPKKEHWILDQHCIVIRQKSPLLLLFLNDKCFSREATVGLCISMPDFSTDLLLWSLFCSMKSHCVFCHEVSLLFELHIWQGSAVTFHRNPGKLKNEGDKVMQEASAWTLVLLCKIFALGHDKRYEKFPKALMKKLSFLQQSVTTQHQEALCSVVSVLLNSSKFRKSLIAACNLYHCTHPCSLAPLLQTPYILTLFLQWKIALWSLTLTCSLCQHPMLRIFPVFLYLFNYFSDFYDPVPWFLR